MFSGAWIAPRGQGKELAHGNQTSAFHPWAGHVCMGRRPGQAVLSCAWYCAGASRLCLAADTQLKSSLLRPPPLLDLFFPSPALFSPKLQPLTCPLNVFLSPDRWPQRMLACQDGFLKLPSQKCPQTLGRHSRVCRRQ